MKLDDSHNDYFVDRGEDTPASTDPKVIDFGPGQGGAEPEPSSRPHHWWRRKWVWWTASVLVAVMAVAFYLRFCNPYVTDARMTGFVTGVEKRGIIFKTYEADFISEAALTDTTRVYSHNVSFSVDEPAVVARLQSLQGSGRPVTVVYETYYATLPWRGASKNVIISILDK